MGMKKRISSLVLTVLLVSALVSGVASAFKPASTVYWYVASSPGGGSDIFTRIISDIIVTEKMVDGKFIVTNKTDGGGEVVRYEISNMKGSRADNSILTLNSGCLMPMVENTQNRSKNFKVLAIMAVDKQLLYKTAHTKYDTFTDAIKAAESGQSIVVGGSKGDDLATFEALVKELGVSRNVMRYVAHDATSDAITAGLGGHVDYVLSKPAAASEYVEAGSLVPVLALAKERFTGNLKDAPTLSEIGNYQNVEVPVWRGIVGPGSMSDAAADFWSNVLRQVSESEQWKKGYIERYMLVPEFMDWRTATEYVTEFEKNFMESKGIKK